MHCARFSIFSLFFFFVSLVAAEKIRHSPSCFDFFFRWTDTKNMLPLFRSLFCPKYWKSWMKTLNSEENKPGEWKLLFLYHWIITKCSIELCIVRNVNTADIGNSCKSNSTIIFLKIKTKRNNYTLAFSKNINNSRSAFSILQHIDARRYTTLDSYLEAPHPHPTPLSIALKYKIELPGCTSSFTMHAFWIAEFKKRWF